MRCKLLILGGYGTFGGRLARLLAGEAALTLVIAGRSESQAAAFCASLPPGARREARALDRDRQSDLERALGEIRPDIVVDASGPFQAYGEDAYRVVAAALAAGCHYFDFADGSDFVRGISRFDEEARRSGLVILAGASTFPVLTAAAVRELAGDLAAVDSICGGVAPSPYAGVGLNVIRAIAGYAGREISVRRNGRDGVARAITETRRYTIAPPGRLPLESLEFSLVDVPDLTVLADLWPSVQSVWMGAGPRPAILHRLLRGLAHLVRLGLLASLTPFASLMSRTINALRWGEHRGGMFVEVTGRLPGGRPVTRAWHLLAEGDDGLFIPAMAIEALVREWLAGRRPPPGARAALRELELADYRRCFASREIHTGRRSGDADEDCLYRSLLGAAWNGLPHGMRTLHAASPRTEARGKARVTRGRSLRARTVAALLRFPRAADAVDVTVVIDRNGRSEVWRRNFGGRKFSSTQFAGGGRWQRLLCERFGPFVVGMALLREQDRLQFVVRRWSFLGIPLPRFLAPAGETFEHERDGRFRFHVEIGSPVTGSIVTYAGYLELL